MDNKVYDLLLDQINKEFYSAYLYLDFANYYEAQGLDGFAKWYEVQFEEEQEHAFKLYHYLHDCGMPVTLEAIAKPDKTFSDLIGPLQAALDHEKYVTSLICNIYDAAGAAGDEQTQQFLQWFIDEQEEEEENATALVTRMEQVGDDKAALDQMNADMKNRD